MDAKDWVTTEALALGVPIALQLPQPIQARHRKNAVKTTPESRKADRKQPAAPAEKRPAMIRSIAANTAADLNQKRKSLVREFGQFLNKADSDCEATLVGS